MAPSLILASTSVYRRVLLDRLRITYSVEPPGIEEVRQEDESPAALASRLAMEKAMAVALRHRQAWVIGSDQVADCDGIALGKPGGHQQAKAQLQGASGSVVTFHTAVCLCQFDSGTRLAHLDLTEVRFRTLDDATIERYLHAEQPWDCAGSFKSEGLGIALFESVRNDDPTALIGLPMIALARMLRQAGFELP